VGTLEQQVVAYLAMKGSYIDRMFVDPGQWRKGWGTRLVVLAKGLSPNGLQLHTHQENHAARKLYEKHGFRAVNFGTSPPPESAPDVEYHWKPDNRPLSGRRRRRVHPNVPEFGRRIADADYRMRPGGYIVLTNSAGDIAVVAAEGGWFLPGGGQEDSERPADAAVREPLEECAFRVELKSLIGIADELVYGTVEAAHFRKRCSFFSASLIAVDDDAVGEHRVTWMNPRDAVRLLAHGSQRWAVMQALRLMSKAGS